jgi:hypothetical protein
LNSRKWLDIGSYWQIEECQDENRNFRRTNHRGLIKGDVSIVGSLSETIWRRSNGRAIGINTVITNYIFVVKVVILSNMELGLGSGLELSPRPKIPVFRVEGGNAPPVEISDRRGKAEQGTCGGRLWKEKNGIMVPLIYAIIKDARCYRDRRGPDENPPLLK